MTEDTLEGQIEAAIDAAREEEVERRIADSGIDVNITPDIPDSLIAEMNSDLTLGQVRDYLLAHEGESFKLVHGSDGLDIGGAERLL